MCLSVLAFEMQVHAALIDHTVALKVTLENLSADRFTTQNLSE